jgi:iron uptake system component EfeO
VRRRSLALAAALAVPALALTGCAADDTSGAAGDTITVTATDTECKVSRTTAPAGQVEFTVTNAGSKVNEFYVYAENDRIVGEVENISPGLTRTFHVDLSEPGTYQTACKPGMVGDGIRADFTVTGSAAAAATSTDGALGSAVAE